MLACQLSAGGSTQHEGDDATRVHIFFFGVHCVWQQFVPYSNPSMSRGVIVTITHVKFFTLPYTVCTNYSLHTAHATYHLITTYREGAVRFGNRDMLARKGYSAQNAIN